MDPSGGTVWSKAKAHKAPVNVVRSFAGAMLATGDDDGGVKLWDTRMPSATAAPVAFKDHEDVITDAIVDTGRATLLTSSGDGRLGVYDLRKPKLTATTEQEDDELLSLAMIKDGQTVVAGTQDGILLTYPWGKWVYKEGDSATYGPDKFKGHPQSIDSLLVFDSDTVITGSSDGLIRLVTIAPNKLVGILGEHDADPIERLAWDRHKKLIASASHDNTVKFWDVAYLYEDDDQEEEDGVGANNSSSSKGRGAAKSAVGGGRSRFADMPALALPAAGGDDDEDDDDDDEDMDSDDDAGDDDDEEDMGTRSGGRVATSSSSSSGRGAGGLKGTSSGSSGQGGAKGKGMGGKGGGFFDDL